MKKITETNRLILQEFTLNDLKPLQKIFSDKDVMRFSIWGPLDKKSTCIFLEKILKSYKEHGYGKWAVIYKKNNMLIGSCGLFNEDIGEQELKAELGYRLAKELWGKGLGTEAAQAVCNYAFNTLNLSELVSCIDEQNIASINVAKKIGMKYWKDGYLFKQKCKIFRIIKHD